MAPTLPSVTIIGFGAFGQLMARCLAPYARLSVLDPSPEASGAAANLGLDVVSPQTATSADILILAVPLGALERLLQELAPHIRPGQLVIDVCSVKEEPARLMRALLPPSAELIGCHPMFGPVSAADGIAGAQIVVCPVRGKKWRWLAAFLDRVLGLSVIVTTAEEHDRQAALTQGLTHLLAHAVLALGDKPLIRTASFELVAAGLAMVEKDASGVFETISKGNRHFAGMRERLLRALAMPDQTG